jgi:hypothetical protein
MFIARRAALVAVALLIGCAGQQQTQETAPIRGSIAGTARFVDASAHAGIHIAVRGTSHLAATDDSGTFLVEDVPSGSYTLEASADGYVTATAPVQVAAGVRSQATLLLGRPFSGTVTIAGSVSLSDGADASGTTVVLDGTSAIAFAGMNGAFSIDGVLPGAYSLEVRRPGYVTLQQAITVAAPTASLGTLFLAPAPTASGAIAGVATRDGAATGNAGISVAVLGTSSSATTADDGSFRIDGIGPGTYAVQLSAGGFTSVIVSSVTVLAGTTTRVNAVALLRPVAGRLVGRVTRGGAATGNGGIAVFLEGTTSLAATDDSGAFEIDVIAPGTYVLAASAPGFLFNESGPVQVLDGQSTQVATVVLVSSAGSSPNGAIAGIAGPLGAVDASGVSVALVASDGSQLATTATDAAGNYSFSAVPLGAYTLRFALAGYSPEQLSNVPVVPGTYQAAEVALYPGNSVSAAATGAGTPMAGSKLLVPIAGGDVVYDWSADTVVTASVPGQVTVLESSADQSHALVQADSRVLGRLDLSSGAYDYFGQETFIYGRYAARWVFADAFGLIHSVGADDATPAAAIQLGCSPSTTPNLSVLPQKGPLTANWIRLQPALCPPYGAFPNILVDIATGQVSPPGDLLGVTDDGSAALMLATDVGSGRNLVSVDLATAAVQVLKSQVYAWSGTSDFVPVWSTPDANGLGTVSRLDLHAGTIVDLLAGSPKPSTFSIPLPTALLQGGTPLAYNVVRFDRLKSVNLCPVAPNTLVSGPFAPVYYCAVGAVALAQPFTLRSYETSSDVLQTLSTSATSAFVSTPSTFVATWQDGFGTRIVRADQPGSTRSICNNQIQVTPDQSTAVALCGQSYVDYDLVHGTTTTLFTAPAGATLARPGISTFGRLVAGGYAMSSGNGACGQPGCGVVVDTTNGLSTEFAATSVSVSNVSTAPGDSAILFYTSFGNYAVAQVGPGAPHVVLGSSNVDVAVTAWASDGGCALFNTAALFDIASGTQTPVPLASLTRIGSSNAWMAFDYAVDLSSCSGVHLGAGIAIAATTDSSITYFDPASSELRSFASGAGITTLLSGVQRIATANGALFAAGGALYQVLADGLPHLLVPSAAAEIRQGFGNYVVAFANPDAQGGDGVLVDLVAQRTLSLGAHVPFAGGYFYGVAGNRFVFRGAFPGDTVDQLFAANLDGSGTKAVGQGTVSGFVGSRLIFTSPDGIQWVEGANRGALAVDESFTLVGLSPDSASMLVEGSAKHAGLWRVALP